jgi:putative transposase
LSYACIADPQHPWLVVVLGEVLGVGRSGLYDSHRRQREPARRGEERELRERLKAMAAKTRHSAGSRRLAKPRQAEGYEVGRFKVRRLLPQAGGTVAGRCRRRPPTTARRHGDPVAPKRLEPPCEVGAPKGAWCGDITDIWTAAGWL